MHFFPFSIQDEWINFVFLHCVFHSIRFKVIKVGATAVALFLCLYPSIYCNFQAFYRAYSMYFIKNQLFSEKTSLKIWWIQKIVVSLHPLKKTKL